MILQSVIETDENGITTNVPFYNTDRIKVTVTNDYNDKDDFKRFENKVSVSLRRLTATEIAKYTHSDETNDVNLIDNKSTNNTINKTRYTTRSKRHKIERPNDEKEQQIVNEIEDNDDTKSTYKRKSETRYTTRSKRPKIEKPNDEKEQQIVNEFEEIHNDEKALDMSCKAFAVFAFKVDEVIWGKIRGWPHWPAKVTRIEQRRFEVEWFNDYRKTKLFRSQMFKFQPNFDIFSEKFSTTIGLEDAACEAFMYLAKKKMN